MGFLLHLAIFSLTYSSRLIVPLRYIPRSTAKPPSSLRQEAYTQGTPIPGPDDDPEGWKIFTFPLCANLRDGQTSLTCEVSHAFVFHWCRLPTHSMIVCTCQSKRVQSRHYYSILHHHSQSGSSSTRFDGVSWGICGHVGTHELRGRHGSWPDSASTGCGCCNIVGVAGRQY